MLAAFSPFERKQLRTGPLRSAKVRGGGPPLLR